MAQRRNTRRTQDQWQAIIDQQQQSGITVQQFCTEHGINPASFYKWRQRLAEPQPAHDTENPSSFIDLSALSSNRTLHSSPDKPWHIVLSLGNGVELRLSQP
ncbi:MAG: transposase, partial [Neptuniibacter sp.]